MNAIDIILIGLALSMDAAALTIANCTTYKNVFKKNKVYLMPLFFAVFQGVMPVIGYFIGTLFAKYISNYAGYIVSAVFFCLAIKIIIDVVKEGRKEDDSKKEQGELSILVLLVQAVATSIDALLVGVTLSLSPAMPIYFAVMIIAGVTAVVVSVSMLIGRFMGKLFGRYAEWAGAVILTLLAVKELVHAII